MAPAAAPDSAESAQARDDSALPLYGLTPSVEAAVADALAQNRGMRLYRLVRALHPADFADLIERQDRDNRRIIVTAVGRFFDPEILAHLDETVREEVLEYLDTEILAGAVAALDSDDAVELLGDLDERDQARILGAIPARDRVIVEAGLAYRDETAGRLMQRELVSVPEHWTVGQTIDYLRTHDELPDDFYDIFIVDPLFRPLGKLALSHLLRTRRPVRVADIMQRRFERVPVDTDQEEVAMLFRRYGLVSTPVVDGGDRLLGVITVDDVVDVIDAEAEEDLMRFAGLSEADIHGGLVDTTRARFSWLAVNLVTAIIASGVIGVFETTIEQVVALAVLMPIVASMGGNAGTQTLTVAVRALAMRELSSARAARFVLRELTVGSLNGIAFAVIAALVSWWWFADPRIAAIMGLAMVITLMVAGLAGTAIPLGLQRLGIDPAIASSVFLTTVTDVVGFFTFLGLAALVLL